MSAISAIFQYGETIQLGLKAIEGDPTTLSNVEAKARLARIGLKPPLDTAPVAINFTVTPRAATVDVPAGFDLVASGSPAAPGTYAVNLKGNIGAATFKTPHLFFRIEESAT